MGLKPCAHFVLWRVSDSGHPTGKVLMLFKGNFQQKTRTILSFNYKNEHTLIIWYYSYESQIDTMIYWRKNPKKAYICAESELDAKCFYRMREKERYWNIYYHYYCIIYWIIYIIDHVILFIRRKRAAKNGELYKNKKTPKTCQNNKFTHGILLFADF